MTRWALMAVAMSAACSRGTLTATVTNDLDGTPLAGVVVTARALDEVSFSCQFLQGETDASGVVTLDGACLSSAGYRITPDNSTVWFIEGDTVEKGASGEMAVKALYAPEGAGAYVLTGDTLSPLSTHGDVKQATVLETEEVVEFPSAIPGEDEIPFVGSGSWLVVTGPDNADTVRLVPLVKSGPRRLQRRDDVITQQDWWYMGVRFASDTEFTRTAAMINPTRIRTHRSGDRAVAVIPPDAVPAGRYALMTASSERITVLDMGARPTEP